MSLANLNINTADLRADSARPADSAANCISPARYFRWQAVICRFVAAVLLIPGAPLMACIILVVRITSRGPGVYRQIRVGKDGRTFLMFKIRSMRIDAEAMTGPAWTLENDPRITPVGRILRKLHLDELPQLFNVLKGDMSLFGPRPERPEFTHVLAKEIPGFLNRLVVLPGITGLAQINLPPDSDMNSVRRKLTLDLEYIKTAGLLLDARMFACTFLRMIGLPGVLAMKIMGLDRTPEIDDAGRSELAEHACPTPSTIVSPAENPSGSVGGGESDGQSGSNGRTKATPLNRDGRNVDSAEHIDNTP